MGYDFVRYERGLAFSKHVLLTPDAAPGVTKQRAWADEHAGTITSWEEFEQYEWPLVKQADFFGVEYLSRHLPEGMGLMTCHAAGVFEHVSQIMSLEGLAFALHDNPELVKAVTDKVGESMLAYYDQLMDLDHVIAI